MRLSRRRRVVRRRRAGRARRSATRRCRAGRPRPAGRRWRRRPGTVPSRVRRAAPTSRPVDAVAVARRDEHASRRAAGPGPTARRCRWPGCARRSRCRLARAGCRAWVTGSPQGGVAWRACASWRPAEVPTPDADGRRRRTGIVGAVRLEPVAELASMLPLVEAEHPATVTSPSDSSAAAAVPAPRPIAHLQRAAVGRRYAASLWTRHRPHQARRRLLVRPAPGACWCWMPFAVPWCRTSRTLRGGPRRRRGAAAVSGPSRITLKKQPPGLPRR